ncbi:putative non-LTR retroelement reverse transcriptase [Tanacetum coccineum]|uniref:Non-LTR retroelement reverse transcriptase n=1 Tax=Tanacetum coccineum TaxID=301880 RepID=A0ABQ5H4J6_9ASTR
MENLLLATEIIKDYHKEDITARCAMKIDISKAFDSVQWPFLLNVLKALDMPDKYIHWINLCISSASFSVQVNGELAGYFPSSRGLRQGCSLSPYLFVICMNVLSKKIDEAARIKRIGLHPGCHDMNLTHLCFADDLMVFVEGDKRSIEGALAVFDDFTIHSGLRISLEKSTIYMAGIRDDVKEDILTDFPFEYGTLPVRYLGLPLLTKKMGAADFAPLIEKIKLQISTWTARQLSFAGRLQLLSSVIFSLTNFWMAAFRLPKSCINKIDKLCASFLWSGPDLKTTKAKLIFRIISSKNSLWVDWIKRHLIRNNSFWALKDNMTAGSWIWKKLLKYRDMARMFYKVKVKCGYSISFWHDSWCSLGCLFGLFGQRGFIELGVSDQTTLGEVMERDRGRIHRNALLNQVEHEILMLKEQRVHGQEDEFLWRLTDDNYSDRFRSKETWQILRGSCPAWDCHRGIWFPFATPKFAFLSWLAAKNRLVTGEKMECWNINVQVGCSFCAEPRETHGNICSSIVYTQGKFGKLWWGA